MKNGNSYLTAEWIAKSIQKFCCSEFNRNTLGDEPVWGSPLIGFANGDDSLFVQIKQQIGEFYQTPREAFRRVFLEDDRANLTVICWILPQTDATKREHRSQTQFSSYRWALSRKFGEQFNDALHHYLIDELKQAGVSAISPAHHPEFKTHRSTQFGISSSWSHRHAAYVAGLGTFGLCDGLITPVGKAMRCGSIVARVAIEPSPRPYDNPHAYCLFYSRGTCQACIRRCPAGAITPQGHNKDLCRAYVFESSKQYIEKNYQLSDVYGCGLCQVRVPCESEIPKGCR